jgi:hypothetical protein
MNRINTDLFWKTAVGGFAVYLLAKVFLGFGNWVQAPMLLDIGGLLQAIAYTIAIVWAIAGAILFAAQQL